MTSGASPEEMFFTLMRGHADPSGALVRRMNAWLKSGYAGTDYHGDEILDHSLALAVPLRDLQNLDSSDTRVLGSCLGTELLNRLLVFNPLTPIVVIWHQTKYSQNSICIPTIFG